jgi:hypothetical protein
VNEQVIEAPHEEPGEAPGPAGEAPKTAIVVVHGMGEQRPMDTLWGFVKGLWICDRDITGSHTSAVYPKPDPITGSFELRRITTRRVPLEDGVGKRADFFEFYWAHLMTGNTVKGVISWILGLFIRNPATVPRRLLFPWIAGLLLLALVAACLALTAKPEFAKSVLAWLHAPRMPWIFPAAAVVSALLSLVCTAWLAPVAGDAARYLSPVPDNVAARQAIREAGVDLLAKLHASGRYDRIVLVGHSLGTVVAYDILTFAWGRIAAEDLFTAHAKGSAALKALQQLELAGGRLRHADPADVGARRANYRAAQRAYFAALSLARTQDGRPLWQVSDFVSCGSPLSSADVLLAHDADAFELRKSQREFPSCPPWLEKDSPSAGRYRFSYPVNDPVRAPHHAAVFAPTVWTNVYFPSFLIVFGDLISGPVAPLLGRGVLDVRVEIGGPFFRHLDYWKDPTSRPPRPWLRAMRRAVNLKWLDDASLWGNQAAASEIRADDLP